MPKRKAAELDDKQHAPPQPEDVDDGEEEEEEEEEDEEYEEQDDSEGSSAPEVSSSEDEEDDDDDNAEEEADEVTGNFNARAPEEDDFHGLKKLLVNYLNGTEYNSSDLVDAIIKQSNVGLVVTNGEGEADQNTSEDDSDESSIWGILTVLNTEIHKAKPFMSQIKSFAMRCCKDHSTKEKLQSAWDAKGTGLIISECVLGLHPKLAPPSLRALLDDIKAAADDNSAPAAASEFKFKRFVALPLVLVETSAVRARKKAAGAGSEGAAVATASGSGDTFDAEDIFYMRPEHEFMHRHCKWSQMVACGKVERRDGFTEYRLVMEVGAGAMKHVLRDLDAEIGNDMGAIAE